MKQRNFTSVKPRINHCEERTGEAISKMKNLCHTGFSLIELVVVIAIMAVLAGMAVPYYQDYMADSRRAVFKQNAANMRKVINDFRGDNGRGPFKVKVSSGTIGVHAGAFYLISDPRSSEAGIGCELTGGPIQNNLSATIKAGNPLRRNTIKYIPTLPVFEDPYTGTRMEWGYGGASAYFVDEYPIGSPDGIFDFTHEFAFIDGNSNGVLDDPATETVICNIQTYQRTRPDADYINSGTRALDYIDITATDSQGIKY